MVSSGCVQVTSPTSEIILLLQENISVVRQQPRGLSDEGLISPQTYLGCLYASVNLLPQ